MTQTTNKSSRLNGDTSAALSPDAAAASNAASTQSAAEAGLAAAIERVTKEHKEAQARTGKKTAPTPPPNEPAFNPPADGAVIDEYHGQGGEYHVVNGKRVRVEPKKD